MTPLREVAELFSLPGEWIAEEVAAGRLAVETIDGELCVDAETIARIAEAYGQAVGSRFEDPTSLHDAAEAAVAEVELRRIIRGEA